jgi:hypothetical protein
VFGEFLEKCFDSIYRGALQFKMRQKEVSDNMVECIKKMYQILCEVWRQ